MDASRDVPERWCMSSDTLTNPPSAAAKIESAAPEFGDFRGLRSCFSIPRSTAYALEKLNEIKFVRLRRRGNLRGRVLVDFDSVRAYLARCAAEDK